MIDIHCHILPNVDDGSKSLDETRDLLYMAKSEGISDILITPHFSRPDNYLCDSSELLAYFNTLKKNCLDIGVNLYLGNELMIENDLDELLVNNKVLSLNNTKYVLVEFPFGGYKREYDDYLMNIELSSYKIIIAHPERYKWVLDNPDKYINRWMNSNYYIQCNAGFIKNHVQKKFVFSLIEKQAIHFVASDGHSTNRPITLKEAYDVVTKRFNKSVGETLFNENPRRLLENNDIINVQHVRRRLFR